MNTKPVYGDTGQLGCTAVGVRFKELRLPTLLHRVSDQVGAELILVNFTQQDSMYVLTYVNTQNMILKRLSYSRESIIELDMTESICLMTAPVKPPTQLKEVK